MQLIESQSGTTHVVNPKPIYTSGKAFIGRVQTLCEMHLRKDEHRLTEHGYSDPSIPTCRFCAAILANPD